MRPEQITLLQSVSAPAVHPSGRWACVATSRPDLVGDAYVGQLWRVELDPGAAPRRITRGFADAHPRFSPDGRLLGFLRTNPGEKPQVHLVLAEGGEPMRVTDAKLGVTDFAFSPNGTMLTYVARVAEAGRYGDIDGVGAGQEDPRHYTGYQIRSNGLGWRDDRPAHLFVIDVPDVDGEPPVPPVGRVKRQLEDERVEHDASLRSAGFDGQRDASLRSGGFDELSQRGEPSQQGELSQRAGLVPRARQLSTGTVDHAQPTFTPDGRAVLAVTSRRPDRDERLGDGVYRFDLAGDATAPEVVVERDELTFATPTFSGDGATLFLLGQDIGPTGRDFVAKNSGVFVVPVGGGEPVRLTDAETFDAGGPGTTLEPHGADAVLTLDRHRGLQRVVSVSRAGVREVLGGTLATGAAAVPGTADDVVVTWVDARSAGDVGVVRGGVLQPLSDFSARLRAESRVSEPVELTASAPDGYPVHGWVWLPEGAGPHPVLLHLHGGPFADYHPTLFDEFQVATTAGYAVVACNPRGSAGYGQAHGAAIRGDFGTLDLADVLAFLDHATATVPGLDAARVGILGGSYGGYLTAWTIAHDHRWAAAVVERGFLDPASFVGASDIGWFFTPEYNGRDLDQMNRQSPTLLARQVTTPTLVVHSEHDLRCPLDQALRYYAELKLGGCAAELLVFPGENHELTRSGTPQHRVQRFERLLAWWARHLPVR